MSGTSGTAFYTDKVTALCEIIEGNPNTHINERYISLTNEINECDSNITKISDGILYTSEFFEYGVIPEHGRDDPEEDGDDIPLI